MKTVKKHNNLSKYSQKESKSQIPAEFIEKKIYFIRNEKVMLDGDLASLYGVETKQLKRAVKRNIFRFPADFMFILKGEEYESLRCQNGTLEKGRHSKYLPYAFTEQGIAMLSSILNSKRAILINIEIIRIFTRLRKMLLKYKELRGKIEDMENKYDYQFKVIFDAIRQMLKEEEKPKKRIGFIVNE